MEIEETHSIPIYDWVDDGTGVEKHTIVGYHNVTITISKES